MNVFLIIGGAGMGKSPFVQQFIKDRRCFVNDVQNEYGKRTKYAGQIPIALSDNINDNRSRYIGDNFDKYVALCRNKRNTVCVFEEATAFLHGRTESPVVSLLIGRYHTGNNYLLLFHSVNSVPPRPYELCNYIVLFKTNDERKYIEKKFPKLLPYFDDLSSKPNGSYHIIKMQ